MRQNEQGCLHCHRNDILVLHPSRDRDFFDPGKAYSKPIMILKLSCARNYRPCFRENQPKRSFSIKWKRAFWACFLKNWSLLLQVNFCCFSSHYMRDGHWRQSTSDRGGFHGEYARSTYIPRVPKCLSPRPNWDPPPPLPQRGDTLSCGWGGGVPILTTGEKA
jgi:hypothetical protein